SAWGLRRMATGGMKLEPLPTEQRARLDISRDSMALLVKRVGQYGPHATAKRAGFKEGDIIVEFDGQTDLMTDSDLLAYGVSHTKPGNRVPVKILRNGRPRVIQLPMQK
ncbi:MAG: PDZ domain-containing protein, partial [Planctomycetaceae bacterium]|nr:PDZ domain-containing protein [Planctomycetaceae bacterium]